MKNVIELLRLLKFTATTSDAAADLLKVNPATTHKWLKELHKTGIVFIAGWLPDGLGRDRHPVYALGAAEDLPKRKYTRAEISRRYRERKQGAGDGGNSGGEGQEAHQEAAAGQ